MVKITKTPSLVVVLFIAVTALVNIQIARAQFQQNPYNLTVNMISHRFGVDQVWIGIKTENGYQPNGWYPTAGGATATFSIGPNQGDTVEICAANDLVGEILRNNCVTRVVTGSDMVVNISAGQ